MDIERFTTNEYDDIVSNYSHIPEWLLHELLDRASLLHAMEVSPDSSYTSEHFRKAINDLYNIYTLIFEYEESIYDA